MDHREELIIKIISNVKNNSKNNIIDIKELRKVLDEVTYNYEIRLASKALVTTDFEEKLKMYIAVKMLDGVAISSLKNYQREIRKFFKTIPKPVNFITTGDVRNYLAMHFNKIKETTMNNKIATLKSFFTWLYEEGYIESNPCRKIKSTKVSKRLRQALTEEELEILRNSCTTIREKALLEFLFSTGCRLSEIVNINKKDINWSELSVIVIGKGNKQRKVYFTIKARLLLQQYLKTRKDINTALFVTSKFPYKRLGGRSIQREIKTIAKNANMDKSVYPHLIRHTFATQGLNNGIPITVLQELMGHENSSTTLIYAELNDNTIKQEYRKL